jgi:UDP-N-acetylmuramoylalanine--D-glutamate ligase
MQASGDDSREQQKRVECPTMSGTDFTNKRVVVMGLGRFGGGVAVTRWLSALGADVIVTDMAPESKLASSLEQLADLPVTFHLGGHEFSDLDHCDLLVVSPAVPKDRSDFVQEAIRRRIPLSSEMNLFVRHCAAERIVGITGSAGKSTTTAMLECILNRSVERGDLPGAWTGGNIGRSLLLDLDAIKPDHVVALELSSFQLEDLGQLRRSPNYALVTNIKPNHLDRHGTMEAYTQAKLNIVRYQRPDDVALVNADNDELASLVAAAQSEGALKRFSFDQTFAASMNVPGRHNEDNAAGAIALARELGLSDQIIADGLQQFNGLAHRLELVGEHDGVRYYNDSKSTTPESTCIALEAFNQPVVIMVGGGDKGMPFDAMVDQLLSRAKGVVCYGETGPRLYDMFEKQKARTGSGTQIVQGTDFSDAVKQASALADSGDVVVLSPACTSYDMFTNYEQRGEAFRDAVAALKA